MQETMMAKVKAEGANFVSRLSLKGLKGLRAGANASVLGACLLVSACGIFGGGGEKVAPFESRVTAIGVNGYLWQATLDTLIFMPLVETDSNAGLILTDWYTAPNNADERVKVAVRFFSQRLRSDAVRVSVVRQERVAGEWVAASVQASTALQIEEAILTQARRLRIEAETGDAQS